MACRLSRTDSRSAPLAVEIRLTAGDCSARRKMENAFAIALTATASTTPDVSRWRPNDPRLAGAAVELDAANMELRQAIEQAPDSPALQRLLMRTQKQQSQLRQMEHQAG